VSGFAARCGSASYDAPLLAHGSLSTGGSSTLHSVNAPAKARGSPRPRRHNLRGDGPPSRLGWVAGAPTTSRD
jgi:hypothetical protein